MKQMTFADAEYTGKYKQTCTVKKGKDLFTGWLSAIGRLRSSANGSYGSIPAGQDLQVRWSHWRQMAGHVRCNFPRKHLGTPAAR